MKENNCLYLPLARTIKHIKYLISLNAGTLRYDS